MLLFPNRLYRTHNALQDDRSLSHKRRRVNSLGFGEQRETYNPGIVSIARVDDTMRITDPGSLFQVRSSGSAERLYRRIRFDVCVQIGPRRDVDSLGESPRSISTAERTTATRAAICEVGRAETVIFDGSMRSPRTQRLASIASRVRAPLAIAGRVSLVCGRRRTKTNFLDSSRSTISTSCSRDDDGSGENGTTS